MNSGITLDNAAIMGTTLEAMLYGFSLLMFIGTIWVLTREDRRHCNWTMITVAVILLVLSTAHLIVDIVRTQEGLVKYRDTFLGGPAAFFGDVAQNTYVIKSAIYTLQTLVGDGVVIYRCYVVWQSVRIIILPSMLWCTVAATGVGSVYSVSQATAGASNIFAVRTAQWVTAFFASTLATNLLSSGILAYKIWTIERDVASIRAGNSTLMPVLRVLVDAAALYSAALFTALLCFVNSNHGEYVVVSMIMPIISIAFYMVMIRVALKKEDISRHLSASFRGTSASHDTSHGLRPLQVHITQFSARDSTPYRHENQDAERDLRCSSIPREKEVSGDTYVV